MTSNSAQAGNRVLSPLLLYLEEIPVITELLNDNELSTGVLKPVGDSNAVLNSVSMSLVLRSIGSEHA